MFTEKYRHIKIDDACSSDAAADTAIAALNSHFDPEDFYVTRNENALEVWLRQVDLNVLSGVVHKIATEYNLPVQTGELIRLYNRLVRGVHEDATYDDDRAYGGVSANRN